MKNMLKKAFLNDRFILSLIVINSITIFTEGFNNIPPHMGLLMAIVDSLITFLFVIEMVVKVRHWSWAGYIKSGWNKVDFVLVLLSVPSILYWFIDIHAQNLSWLLVFRIARVFKFFRFLKFIPDIDKLALGIQRALKDSVLVLIGFVIYNFIVSIFSCYLFKGIAPEFFGDPLTSFYSTFKIFTVEGWYEIPDLIRLRTSSIVAFFSVSYFMIILVTGGILGLSLVNSIFVDAMVSDNNDPLIEKVDYLTRKVEELSEKLDKTKIK